MIKNERQYQITRDWIREFKESIAAMEKELTGSPDAIARAEKDGMKHKLSDLEREVREYDELKHSKNSAIKITSIRELPRMLIRAKIASGITEKELAGMVGISEEQLQRHEDFDYQDATYSKMREIAFVLKNKEPYVVHDEPAPAIKRSAGTP